MVSFTAADAERADAGLWRLSVVIPNFNYGRFLAQAIDSVLALDWPDVEVIVVDDGSTDDSRHVIERYGRRIRSHFQPNRGQLEACNVGFEMSSGEAVQFLDADDVVSPDLARALHAVWHPKVSKVQFQMRAVDARLAPTGTFFPQFHVEPSPREVRDWMLATSTYPTPPGSGNVYSRWFLRRIFPLSEVAGRYSDSCCIAAAPLLGDVVTVPRPLVSYRVHGANDGAMSGLQLGRLGREVRRAIERYRYADSIARPLGLRLASDAWRISLHTLPYRIGSWRLDPAAHPVDGEHRLKLLRDLWRGWRQPQGLRGRAAATILLWGLAVLLGPRTIAARLVLWRYDPLARPQVIRRSLARLGIVRG